MNQPWDELRIEPTGDTGVIKRAYASRLKSTRPEEDPAGFQRLRAAYEVALDMAQPKNAPAAAVSASDQPAPASDQPVWPSHVLQEVDRLQAAFSSGDSEFAVRAAEASLGRQILPFDLEARASSVLIGILLRDRTIRSERLLEIAKHFGWYGVPDALRGPNAEIEHLLCLRIDAEFWLMETRKLAVRWKSWLGWSRAAAARLVLGSGPILLSRVAPPNPQLFAILGAAFMYAPVLGGVLNEQRLGRLAAYGERGAALGRLTRNLSYFAWLGTIGLIVLSPMLRPVFDVDAVRLVLAAIIILNFASNLIRRWVRPPVVFSWVGALAFLAWAAYGFPDI